MQTCFDYLRENRIEREKGILGRGVYRFPLGMQDNLSSASLQGSLVASGAENQSCLSFRNSNGPRHGRSLVAAAANLKRQGKRDFLLQFLSRMKLPSTDIAFDSAPYYSSITYHRPSRKSSEKSLNDFRDVRYACRLENVETWKVFCYLGEKGVKLRENFKATPYFESYSSLKLMKRFLLVERKLVHSRAISRIYVVNNAT